MGLPIEEALVFWRKAFTAATESDLKSHEYNVKHTYGLAGGMKKYSPKSFVSLFPLSSPHITDFDRFSDAAQSSPPTFQAQETPTAAPTVISPPKPSPPPSPPTTPSPPQPTSKRSSP